MLRKAVLPWHDSDGKSTGMWKDWLGRECVSPGTRVFGAELRVSQTHLLKFEHLGPQNMTLWRQDL